MISSSWWVLISLLVIGIGRPDVSAQEECENSGEGPSLDCIRLDQCPSLYKLLRQSPISREVAYTLRQAQCGFSGHLPKVCCPDDIEEASAVDQGGSNSKHPPNSNSNHNKSNNNNGRNGPARTLSSPFLPSLNECGTSTEDRIYGGEETDLGEFPWMALLEYRKTSGRTDFYCGGVLINHYYILTAAHCINGKDVPKQWRVISVRLGEHDLLAKTDCIDTGYGKECSPPPIDVPVAEHIVHEGYRPNNVSQPNDIALLRLAQPVTYSNYVKPICLPLANELSDNTFLGRKLSVAGWGKTESRSNSNVKLKVQVPVRDMDACSKKYAAESTVRLGKGQMCAGGDVGKDSCRGDSGGPLMTVAVDQETGETNWYSIGVVSFGPTPCGMLGWPAVYTKVSDHLEWIISKIKM